MQAVKTITENQLTVNQPGQLSLSTKLQAIGKDLTEFEVEVIKVKYQSKRISELQEIELPVAFKTLLFRIHTITGWKLPDDDLFLKILVDEFSKFMVEKYSDLNTDEVSFAFRNYGTSVKDWGKSMNLSLVDEPLTKYLEVRRCLSELEERKAQVSDTTLKIEPVLDPDELLESVKSVYLKVKKVGLIPVKVYEILVERNEIDLTIEEKQAIRARVIARLNNEAITQGEKEIYALKSLSKRDYEIKVRNECKKQAVANYFELQNNIDNF